MILPKVKKMLLIEVYSPFPDIFRVIEKTISGQFSMESRKSVNMTDEVWHLYRRLGSAISLCHFILGNASVCFIDLFISHSRGLEKSPSASARWEENAIFDECSDRNKFGQDLPEIPSGCSTMWRLAHGERRHQRWWSHSPILESMFHFNLEKNRR